MATSTCMPRPLRCRSSSAAWTPIAVKSPAAMSPSDVPTRVGGPPGWPVRLMMPPMPCTTMS